MNWIVAIKIRLLSLSLNLQSPLRIIGQLYFDNGKKTEPKHVSNDNEEDQAKDDEKWILVMTTMLKKVRKEHITQ